MRDWVDNGRWLVLFGDGITAVCRYMLGIGVEVKCCLVVLTESIMKNTNSRLATLGNVYI
ncbi:MAG: hypothetical protein M5U34_27040 [Chloroflexi bacterium]|nr:hypothetical protein [Chloroflexota bacterium]